MSNPRRPSNSTLVRPLGLLVTCGFERVNLEGDLTIAHDLGATCVEMLPHWRSLPDPAVVRRTLTEAGLPAVSVHGGWGGQAILADRIDLASLEPATRRASVDDMKRCLEWAWTIGAERLIVHPGGLSDAEDTSARAESLKASLRELLPELSASGRLCVENMPPGVHPGSQMRHLADLLCELDHTHLGLALDTGHAQLVSSPEAATFSTGGLLATTHVHDNDGRRDLHQIPGEGVIHWPIWLESLDRVNYSGPLILECIRAFRERNLAELLDLRPRVRTLLGLHDQNE